MIEIVEGDITRLSVDAIVNAANQALAPGGGVCGAIHRAAGPELAIACQRLAPCPTGEARITEGFALPARFAIHAVGPAWRGGGAGEADLLASCYRAALRLARENGASSIAFPAISTGIYGYPAEDAAAVALAAIRDELSADTRPLRVLLCCFDKATAAIYRRLLVEG